jgi:tRNA pseudouridine38-40 synthase
LLRYDIEANAFLLHMVRRIVGALVEVGTGRRQAGDIRRLLQSGTSGEASRTAPARGLCLMKVRYESGIFEDEKHEDI